MRLLIVFLLLTLCSNGNALKILLYNPKISKSTVGFMNKVGDVLTEGGHEVVQYMPELDYTFGNGSNSKTARVIERKCDFVVPDEMQISQLGQDGWTEETNVLGLYTAEQFDIALTDFFDVCGFAIFDRIGIQKHIMLYSAYLISLHGGVFGIPQTPSFVPDFEVFGNPVKGLTFYERFMSQISFLMSKPAFDVALMQRTADSFKENGINTDLHEMMTRSSYVFVNTDEHVDFPRPISHKIINIGGLRMKSMQTQGKLDEKYQKIFDNARLGVIFVSFGSIASSYHMPNQTKEAFLDAFIAFPEIEFLWKYEKPEDPVVQGYKNVHVGAWLPQKEIFAQEKLIGFVSHGGMNSISEATYSGIPIIAVPLFGDQPRNALMVESREIGIVLNKRQLTSENIIRAFRQIIEDKTFKQNARQISQMIREKPTSPDERVLKYTEHAAKFDISKNLDLPGRHLNTVVFYNLDVWTLIIMIVGVFSYILFKAFAICCQQFCLEKWKNKE
ncbi:UDP-glucuronosyltransferase [Aphelenchoides bicaudatus]|nr:UDP-glucuronosyltransferase [Aphelenchoides bicaudatus]